MPNFVPPAHNSGSPFADMRGHHVAVRTPDLETAKRWYVDSLTYAGYHHFCLTVSSVDETVTQLRARGVTIVTEPFVLPVISRRLAIIGDPFGNLIELAEVLA
jgi:lactoylglutathione lyase/glyoxylase I family protein